jgi:hypothetical protein
LHGKQDINPWRRMFFSTSRRLFWTAQVHLRRAAQALLHPLPAFVGGVVGASTESPGQTRDSHVHGARPVSRWRSARSGRWSRPAEGRRCQATTGRCLQE